jgi:hypothetical protein
MVETSMQLAVPLSIAWFRKENANLRPQQIGNHTTLR